MRITFPEALVSVPDDLVEALTCIPDPNDRHVLRQQLGEKQMRF